MQGAGAAAPGAAGAPLAGKVAVITGSARGLGLAMAEGYLMGFVTGDRPQLAPFGVRMNALYPGDSEVRGVEDRASRMGRPIMVPAAIYLRADASSAVTGQRISALDYNQEHGLPVG